MSRITLIYFIALLAVVFLPLRSIFGQSETPPDGTCSSQDGIEHCIYDQVPGIPNPCDQKMNDIWATLQAGMDELSQDPACADYSAPGESGSGVMSILTLDTGKTNKEKVVVIKKKALRKLRRQATSCQRTRPITK